MTMIMPKVYNYGTTDDGYSLCEYCNRAPDCGYKAIVKECSDARMNWTSGNIKAPHKYSWTSVLEAQIEMHERMIKRLEGDWKQVLIERIITQLEAELERGD